MVRGHCKSRLLQSPLVSLLDPLLHVALFHSLDHWGCPSLCGLGWALPQPPGPSTRSFLPPPIWRTPGDLKPGSDLTYQTSQPLLGDRLALVPHSWSLPSKLRCAHIPVARGCAWGKGTAGTWGQSVVHPAVPTPGTEGKWNSWKRLLAQGSKFRNFQLPTPAWQWRSATGSLRIRNSRWVGLYSGFGVKKTPMVLFWIPPRVLFLLC